MVDERDIRDEPRGGANAADAPPDRPSEDRGPTPTPVTQQIGRVVVVAAMVLFGVFAAVNVQRVDYNWVFGETEVVQQGGEYVSGGVPLIVLLVAAFVLGGIVGAGLVWRQQRRRRSARSGQRARADETHDGPDLA